MSDKLYLYEMEIVDSYTGMMPLINYIKISKNINNYICEYESEYYLSHRELKSFLIKCFMKTKTHETYWEGDIRGLDEIAISAIPRPSTQVPYKMIVFKQDNNGQSYLVSECKIDTYHEDDKTKCEELINIRKFNEIDLYRWFEQSYDLVESLFDKALNKINKCSNNKIQDKNTIIENKQESENLINDKFNLSDYEMIK